MRPGIVLSSGAHAAVLAWTFFGLMSARPYDVGPTESLPIEIVTPQEFDQLTKGSRTSKVVDSKPQIRAVALADADPEDKPEAVKEAKREVAAPPPPPPPPTPQPKAETPPPPKPAAKAEPEPPKPEPKKAEPKAEAKAPEPKPEPKPAPEKAEAKPEPKPEPKEAKAEPPKPEPKKPEPKPEPPKAEAKETPKPEPKKEPAKVEPPKPPEQKFDSSKIAALLNKQQPVRTASAARDIAPTTTAGIPRGTAARLSLSERSAIDGAVREQIAPCWNPPVGAAGAENMRTRVRFQLNSDGSLSGFPTVTEMANGPGAQAAADSALRAVRRCSPLRLPAQAYDYWRDIEINFDPRDMLGG